jgi:hypothetical protein
MVKSQSLSEATLNSKGPGAPPKDKQSIIKARSSCGIWVTVLMAVSQLRCMRQYANSMSSFFCQDPTIGIYSPCYDSPVDQSCEAFAKFALLEEVSVGTQVATCPQLGPFEALAMGEPVCWHSFATFVDHPLSLDVNSAMHMPSSCVILLRGRGRAYPWMTLP